MQLPASQFAYVDTSIVGGLCYKYAATSSNILGGESDFSIDFMVTPTKAPSGMTAPKEVTHDQTSITLQWMAPDSDGSSPITAYVLYAKADYESSFKEVYIGMTLSHKVVGLRTGFYHQFKIQSVNVMGSSELSQTSVSILTAVSP